MLHGVAVSKGRISSRLLGALRRHYSLSWDDEPVDLGGSNNLNVHLPQRAGGHVARVYRAWTTSDRLRAIQHARSSLVAAGLPCPPTVATVDGDTRVNVDGREVEVEQYINGHGMDIRGGLVRGMRMLGKVHSVLGEIRVGPAGALAPHPNHIEADRARIATRAGTATIRADHPSMDELAAAAVAEALADELADAELELAAWLPRQLVHGDFWYNNVLFCGDAIVGSLTSTSWACGHAPTMSRLPSTTRTPLSGAVTNHPSASRYWRNCSTRTTRAWTPSSPPRNGQPCRSRSPVPCCVSSACFPPSRAERSDARLSRRSIPT